MPYENKDVRIVNGEVSAVSESIKDYFKSNNFHLVKDERLEKKCYFEGMNLQQSPINLYLSASPQISRIQVENKSEEEVQVEITFGLFTSFRLFYYSVYLALLLAFGLFYKAGIVDKTKLTPELYHHSTIMMFSGVACLILAMLFMGRLLGGSPYENFLEGFYEYLSEKGLSEQTVLKGGYSFPDMWLSLFIFIGFVIAFMAGDGFFSSMTDLSDPAVIFFYAAMLILALLIALLAVMYFKPAVVPRVLFCLLGIALCLPVAVFGNAPLFTSLTSDMVEKIRIEKASNNKASNFNESESERSKRINKRMTEVQVLWTGLLTISFVWAAFTIVVLFLLWNALQLPIRIIRQLDRFYSKHSESVYYHSLQPEKSSTLFGVVIAVLWVAMSATILSGLYFSLFVFEKVLLGTNIVPYTILGDTFYNDTKTMSEVFQAGFQLLNHGQSMLVYSLPLVLMFAFVLLKNLWSFLKEGLWLVLPGKFKEAEAELIEKVIEICGYAGVRFPVVRMTKSSYINSETQYLGFPFFRNILIVTDTAFDKLQDDELDALLAHEVGHIKKHSFIRKVLCFFSDYTLFGNGFLALLQNSHKIEHEADDFAVEWLEKKGGSDKTFKSLLRRQSKQRGMVEARKSILGLAALNFEGFKDDAYRKKILATYRDAFKIRKIWINLALLFKMYFGREVISYFHPSNEQRIAWVEK